MFDVIRKNRLFFYPYLLILLFSSYFVFSCSKTAIHLWMNQYHAPLADFFFRYITQLGNGIFLPLYLALIIGIRYRYGLLLILSFLLSGLIVQLLKRYVFNDIDRPVKLIGEAYLYLVPGVQQHCCNSFPSGHSASAFSMMLSFALALKNQWAKFGLFLLAAFIAYSRIYLSQHFLIDTMAGSFIGIVCTVALHHYIAKLKNPWLDKSFHLVFSKRE